MRIRIGICDDEQVQIEFLKKLLKEWSEENGHTVFAQTFGSAEAFLFTYAEDRDFDILLLDIQMKNMDGVTLAREVRRENSMVQIIFITGFTDYAADGYDVSALHYLLKPVNGQKLRGVMDRAVELMQTAARTVLLPLSGGSIRIRANEIYYAEAFSHYVGLYTKSGQTNFNMRLSDMEKLLGDGFFRCHRSYIVGMEHVRQVTRTAMVMDTGKEIPLSRKLYDEANQAFILL